MFATTLNYFTVKNRISC